MRRSVLFGLLLSAVFALPLCAQDQQEQSLGDVARQARKAKEDRDKSAPAQAKVFTDENMPSSAVGKADLARLASPNASVTERMATARKAISRAQQLLDTLAPMDRATLAGLALQGQRESAATASRLGHGISLLHFG